VPAPARSAPPHVAVTDNDLVVDGKPTPYLFGAEVQYFRARGGAQRNVPAAEVKKLWNTLLDRVTAAHMNTVSFYVPWDFHEPKEGVFDFTGTLDQDGDGKPDYPSRDLKGFFAALSAHGIKHLIVRPGPYINAEWGPTGFGAIPLWFLERYPEAIATTKTPGKPRTVSFAHPVFRDRARKWFTALYNQVLKGQLGPGKPTVVLQLDNETNYFWDSVYERDWSALGVERFRDYARRTYNNDAGALSKAWGAHQPLTFATISPPSSATDHTYPGPRWHEDWYRFHDDEIRDYHRFVRGLWEELGVKEPDVLFTTCESYNAYKDHGLVPRLDYRGDGRLALATLNIYPKTEGTQAQSTLNTPMKGAHDAALISASHAQMYGTAGNWLMSTETVGGWFPPVEVSLATREHTYGALLGTGVKAMIIYYFHEGWNWDGKEQKDTPLSFDAPLDGKLTPRPSYALLTRLGAALAGPLGKRLMSAKPVTTPVLLAHATESQYPLPKSKRDLLKVVTTESAGLYGFFREAGALPELGYVDKMSDAELARFALVVWNSPDVVTADVRARLERYISGGGTVLVIGDTKLTRKGKGKLVRWNDNPAAPWDRDDYLTLKDAAARLDRARALLRRANVAAPVAIAGADRKPYLHAWLRKSDDGALLLFVENFARGPRTATVKVAREQLADTDSFTVTRLFSPNASDAAGHRIIPAAELSAGVSLPVSGDGVDVWELAP
jgi:hypothetical protein